MKAASGDLLRRRLLEDEGHVVEAFRRLLRRHDGRPSPELERVVAEEFQRLYDHDMEGVRPSPPVERAIVEQFHRLYYHDHGTWRNTAWRGVPTWKCPLDLWLYQEMLFEVRPGLVVETGTAFGGSAYYLASLCDLLGRGRVVTIDVEARADRPSHPRITYLTGSSTDPATLERVRAMLPEGDEPVMAILDSDHRREHVLDELRAYGPLVTKGSYLVAEDTNVNGHPAYPDFGPGPMEAVESFLAAGDDFAVDPTKHKFFMTFNPGGYLKKR